MITLINFIINLFHRVSGFDAVCMSDPGSPGGEQEDWPSSNIKILSAAKCAGVTRLVWAAQ